MYSDVAKPDLIQWWNTICMLTALIEHLTVLLEYFDQLISMAGIANTREDLTLHSLPMVTSLVYDQGWGRHHGSPGNGYSNIWQNCSHSRTAS